MTTLEEPTTTLWRPADATPFDEAQLAAAAFLARYSGNERKQPPPTIRRLGAGVRVEEG
jgi:hypothetical protein